MSYDNPRLAEFGWSAHFEKQLTLAELDITLPVRVVAVHRNGLDVVHPEFALRILPLAAGADGDGSELAAVGDWLLLSREAKAPVRLLERKSLFRRKAIGGARRFQLIAANVDTLFIVSSCNQDFNIARLERYLALAREAGVMPVIVLTKADLAGDTAAYARRALGLMPGLLVETLDARDPGEAARLAPWCGRGQTVALVGSSGVGKSTLVNTLAGDTRLATAPIREDDARGRHTTTGRALHRLPAGGWLLDTPGMRELQLAEAAEGIVDVFADITALAASCRFADCRHEAEPDCAVLAAVEDGRLDGGRLDRYRKLAREDARNSEAIWDRKARVRRFGRVVKEAVRKKGEGRWEG